MTAADRPSVTLRVGDTITTAEQLDALPLGSVMRAQNDLLAETGTMAGRRVVWAEGWSGHSDTIEYLAPLMVLYVPGEPSRPSVTDIARAEAIKDAAAWLDRLYPNGLIAKKSVLADLAEWADRAKRGLRASGREWAAGRAETTTATTEDAAGIDRAEVRRVLENEFWPFLAHDPHDPDRFWGQAVDAVMGLLATDRTRPTREQVIDLLREHDPENHGGQDAAAWYYEAQADAVLALYADHERAARLRGGDPS